MQFSNLYYLLSHRINSTKTGFTGIHSPFLYRFAANISRNLWPYYDFNEIEVFRRIITKRTGSLIPSDIKQLLYKNYSKKNSINRKVDVYISQTIFRIINDVRPDIMVEIGSYFGIDTLYMSKASSDAKIISITENDEMKEFIKKTVFQEANECISFISRNRFYENIFQKIYSLNNSFILFNTDDDLARLKNDFNLLLNIIDEKSIFAVKSIHDNKIMRDFWVYITNHSKVTSCIDLFDIGIIFFKTDLPKTIYYLKPENLKI